MYSTLTPHRCYYFSKTPNKQEKLSTARYGAMAAMIRSCCGSLKKLTITLTRNKIQTFLSEKLLTIWPMFGVYWYICNSILDGEGSRCTFRCTDSGRDVMSEKAGKKKRKSVFFNLPFKLQDRFFFFCEYLVFFLTKLPLKQECFSSGRWKRRVCLFLRDYNSLQGISKWVIG